MLMLQHPSSVVPREPTWPLLEASVEVSAWTDSDEFGMVRVAEEKEVPESKTQDLGQEESFPGLQKYFHPELLPLLYQTKPSQDLYS